MEDIKKYRKVRPSDDWVTFDLKRTEEIYKARQGQPDVPHRHDYYTILLTSSAAGKHIIDFHEFDLRGQQVYFVSPDQVHQIIEEEATIGWVITFAPLFLSENNISKQFIEEVHLFQSYGYAPPLTLTPNQLHTLQSTLEQIADLIEAELALKYEAIGALLKLFLIHCYSICKDSNESNTQKIDSAAITVRTFKQALEEHFKDWHKVSDYAAALHITPDHLNTTLKHFTGRTAKEHIQSRITVEAQRQLLFTDATHKEIAYALGFSNPANFSQFFKNCTGLSPTAFADQHS